MRRWLENLEQFAIDVILERRFGKKAAVFRWLLYLLSIVYCWVVRLRIALYRNHYKHSHHLGCMVITIGNLTVGGTGKTPVVEKVARALQDGGRRVAILSRGYKSKKPPLLRRLFRAIQVGATGEPPRVVHDGRNLLLDSAQAGDEPYMLARNLKNVIVLTDKDRVKSGLFAIRNWGVDTLVLDDGFQHFKIKHRIDIVLIDRQAPFGNQFLLPRGTLREPPEQLRRARYIFITKSILGGNEALIQRIRQYNRTAEIIECTHRPMHLENLVTGETLPLDFLQGQYVASLCAIAQPSSFEQAIRDLGANLELTRQFADHHRFTAADIASFLERCRRRDLAAVITTEKDAVRFPKINNPPVPILFLRVEIEILTGHESWNDFVARLCSPKQFIPPEKFFL